MYTRVETGIHTKLYSPPFIKPGQVGIKRKCCPYQSKNRFNSHCGDTLHLNNKSFSVFVNRPFWCQLKETNFTLAINIKGVKEFNLCKFMNTD